MSAQPTPDDVRPVSELPRSGPPPIVVIAGFALLAVLLFFVLEGRRHEAAHPKMQRVETSAPLITSPPPLVIPSPPPPPVPEVQKPPPPLPPQIKYIERPAPPAPPPIIRYIERPAPAVPQASPTNLGRLSESPLVIDLAEAAADGKSAPAEEAAARASVLRNRSFLVPQGTLVTAVLETPVDTSRPGPVRALTSTDTRGFDGTRVLIPRGSRLVGETKADTQAGQRRVLITWNRLVRPDGVAVRLVSPASDPVGGTGVPGHVDDHLLARLSGVILQSVLTVGVNLASRPSNGGVVVAVPSQALSGAGQTLVPTQDQKPTITVKEGTPISIFVVRDLDFTGTLQRQ